jgi:hypothetical protein
MTSLQSHSVVELVGLTLEKTNRKVDCDFLLEDCWHVQLGWLGAGGIRNVAHGSDIASNLRQQLPGIETLHVGAHFGTA